MEVFGDDIHFVGAKGILPIGEIRSNLFLNSVGLKVINPLKVCGTNENPVSLALGTDEDDDFFIPWFTPRDLRRGIGTVWNGGEYFKEHLPFKSDVNVYLSYGFLGNVFNVGPSLLSAGSCGSASGSGYEALFINGFSIITQYFNGNAWVNGESLLIKAHDGCSTGESRNCLLFGGNDDDSHLPPYHNKSQFFNGISWTMFPELPYDCISHGAVGKVYDTLMFGGHNYISHFNHTLLFNGISWSQMSSMGTARYDHAFFGRTNGVVAAGGRCNPSDITISCEEYNGILWYYINSMLFQRDASAGFGETSSYGLVTLGYNTTGTLCDTHIYREPVWMIGSFAPSQGRREPSSVGDERAGILVGGHEIVGGNENPLVTVDLLRPETAPIRGQIGLIFIFS
ncbi:MAG: hypothetical protein QW835_00165 [Candidatus Hadarchaeum sp.]